jgi:replication factor A1
MAKQIWRGRGRRSNSMHSYKDGRILEYIARIALTHKVDSSEFFNCIVEAWNQEESECKQLAIRCRERTKNSAIFLFTNGRKVVAQFSIPLIILQGKNQLESYMKTISAKTSSVKNFKGENSKIGDLKAGMKRIDLKAEVLKLSEPKMVYTRYGSTAYVSNALIKDETGSMRMSLWNQQINMVHKGDVINIKNGNVSWFSGERQLNLGRNGSLSVIE